MTAETARYEFAGRLMSGPPTPEATAILTGNYFPEKDVEGFPAIAHYIHENIYPRIEDHASLETGFSSETRGLSVPSRGIIAQLEYERTEGDDRDKAEPYHKNSGDYAEHAGTTEGPSMLQTELIDWEEHQERLEELNRNELEVVLKVLASGEEIGIDILDEIEDAEAFLIEYTVGDSVDEAIKRSRFDSSLPDSVINHCADPDEWPDDLDPRDVSVEHCVGCRTQLYEIHADGGETWLQSANVTTGKYIRNADRYYSLTAGTRGAACHHCKESAIEDTPTRVLFPDGTAIKVRGNTPQLFYDDGEEGHDPVTRLSSSQEARLGELFDGSRSYGEVVVDAEQASGVLDVNTGLIAERLVEYHDNPHYIGDEPVVVEQLPYTTIATVYEGEARTAQEIKKAAAGDI